ncbi:ATP-dependent protease ATPase subunit HslU [Caldalkalibacillus salinus]|uniref:ATP-dependent protease ATPase subunit HslU n=1 Tax=Caldalkalibacillus salinus TaxID=2803787 RepID=UPI0023511DFB|nr:ATP-dependent protease ATPase subunit HslU [Caldalkalibacillus salinus]
MTKRAMTPKEIVAELDRYIVGQSKAKKSVAIALRNRYRRSLLPSNLQDEIVPKNILMMGPTGVGKTEIARRLAKLVGAPFIKIEATKFTEVGYVGRDVESMVRDLVETAIRMVKEEKMEEVQDQAKKNANNRLAEIIVPSPKTKQSFKNPMEMLFGQQDADETEQQSQQEQESLYQKRRRMKHQLELGELEDHMVEIEVEDQAPNMFEIFSGQGVEQMGVNMQDLFGQMMPKKTKKRKLPVSEARKILTQVEAGKLIDMDEVHQLAIQRAEQSGMIFIDEIDKIASGQNTQSADVSREGVQRDILPIVEGATVMTKYGAVRTDYVLFVAAGAFHMSKPSDLIPELQGRFPIRVELQDLGVDDFVSILTEPQNAITKQYVALLETEGIKVEFSDNAIVELAKIASEVNRTTDNIGARRLHTILEKLLEDLSFEAPDITLEKITITPEYVHEKLDDVIQDKDLSQYIL